ncbi:MAG: SURF1 family cytochrome oxidase biogenesis protein [Gordonia sp. (in: high G+C Gram-positive bacteria)]
MRVLRTFLRPQWIALAVVVIAFAALCFSILAPWQLGKNSRTSHRNHLIAQAAAMKPVPLDSVSTPGVFDPATEWREVTMRGEYLTDKQALVRLRSVGEQPAMEILTPFRLAGTDRVVAVDRGYVRPQQSAVPNVPAAPAGIVTINGRIRASEGTSVGRGAGTADGALSMYTVDPAELARATHVRMDPFYLQLSPGQPGSLGEIPLPQLDSGPYLSYGLQWLAFGIMAPLGAGYFVYAEISQRRRAAATADSPTSGAAHSPPDSPAVGSAPHADTGRGARRKKLRAELRGEEFTDTGDEVAIGAGPNTAHRPAQVRDKLTARYGG